VAAGQLDPSSFDVFPLRAREDPIRTLCRVQRGFGIVKGQQLAACHVLKCIRDFTGRQSHLGKAWEPLLAASGPLVFCGARVVSSLPVGQYDEPNEKGIIVARRLTGWLGPAAGGRRKEGRYQVL
jgi:hypothetical protein